jgi:hypothetical protein
LNSWVTVGFLRTLVLAVKQSSILCCFFTRVKTSNNVLHDEKYTFMVGNYKQIRSGMIVLDYDLGVKQEFS